MGSGKSTLGKKLAKKLNQPFYDLDALIEKAANKSIIEIFEHEGQEYFRELEQHTLKELTNNNNDFVLALGGGTPCFYDNMNFINANGCSIYLKYNSGILCSRLINAKAERPLLKDKPDEQLKSFIDEKLIEREKFYLKSRFIIENKNITTNDIINLI